ncbi:hypothetical protein C353_06272 [Cryptococcus neoformans AD1-83a]|nr:hypothetical protein C353_06272 [Cryptococcus neoformans var. grubii AD1-83a]
MPQAPHHQKESISCLFKVVAVGDEEEDPEDCTDL